MNEDIVVVADTQIRKGSNTIHLEALAKLIWKKKPKYIVHIGDNFDFPSLSSYSSVSEKEGQDLGDDITYGQKALRIIPEYIKMMNKKHKKKYYKPELHFTAGNHENRLNRYLSENPKLKSTYNLEKIIKDCGWEYHKFLDPHFINGIMFNHYIVNPMSGKAVAGSGANKLNKTNTSFVVGHSQQYQYERRQTMSGSPHFGVVAGSFYLEDEGYRGTCNSEIRGIPFLKGFINRFGYQDYDVNFISLERLQEMFVKDGGNWEYGNVL